MDEIKNNVIKKSNVLISAKFKLGINEQKILYKIISYIHIEDKDFKDYVVSISDIIKFLDADKNKRIHSYIRTYIKNLMKEILIFKENGNEVHTHWISLAEYKEDNKAILFNFHPRLKPYLIDLKGYFSSWGTDNVRRFKNKYSPRLYEMLKQFEDTGFKIISVKDLRYILCLEDKYKKYNDFKKNAILMPQIEINKSDISFEFQELKTGKTIKKLHFYIKKNQENSNKKHNKPNKKNNSSIGGNKSETINLSNDKINELKAKIKDVIDDEIDYKKIVAWIELKKENDILYYLENWTKWDYKEKHTKAGFFVDLVDNNRQLPIRKTGMTIKPIQATNYEQREYDDDFFNSLYDNNPYGR